MTNRPYSSTIQSNFRDVMGTPAAPEVFDDQTPLIPTVDVSLQKDTESILQTVGKTLISAYGAATNGSTTLFTAGAKGARIHAANLVAINGAGNGVAYIGANGTQFCIVNAYNTSAQSNNINLGGNYILVAAGTNCVIVSPNANVTATGTVIYRQL